MNILKLKFFFVFAVAYNTHSKNTVTNKENSNAKDDKNLFLLPI